MYKRFVGVCLLCLGVVFSELPAQEPTNNPASQQQLTSPPQNSPPQSSPQQQDPQASNAMPPAQQGVEVLARGPIHEAFATPTTEPVPGQAVPKIPPKAIDEMPPAEKPSGDSAWISGYWAWDDDRHDFLWVSGIWRTPPPGKKWVAGYWKQDGTENRWVSGFWTNNGQASDRQAASDQITYLPQPPAPPQTAPPGEAPNPESFYVPGHWEWRVAGYQAIDGAQVYRQAGYAWVPGYWAKVQPGYVWVSAHYTWSPTGYVYVPGYWDLSVASRGVIYAPVYIDPLVVGPTFVYTPSYIVRDTVIIDNLWIRPAYRHYYFGDYYGGVYAGIGFHSAIVFSSRHYDPIITYARYENRGVVGWNRMQVDLVFARNAGRAPVPPRTLVQQNNVVINNVTNVTNVTNVNNVNKNIVNNSNVTNNNIQKTSVLAPANQLSSVKGVQTTALSRPAQAQAKMQAQSIQQVSQQRSAIEARQPAGGPMQGPRTTSMSVPSVNPVTTRGVMPQNVGGPNTNNLGRNGSANGMNANNGLGKTNAPGGMSAAGNMGRSNTPNGVTAANGTNPPSNMGRSNAPIGTNSANGMNPPSNMGKSNAPIGTNTANGMNPATNMGRSNGMNTANGTNPATGAPGTKPGAPTGPPGARAGQTKGAPSSYQRGQRTKPQQSNGGGKQ